MTKNRKALAHSAADKIITCTHTAVDSVNDFTVQVFHTRGGRIGSGMGSVIEALWGFHLNTILNEDENIAYELGWIYGHEYNDFSCILRDEDWNPETQQGELLSMAISFDPLSANNIAPPASKVLTARFLF